MVQARGSESLLDNPVSRRKLLTLAGQSSLGLLLAACAGAAPTATPIPTRAPAATPTPTPKPVKESLTVVFPGLPTQLDPHVSVAKDRPVTRNLYEFLRSVDFVKFGFRNELATDTTVDGNGNYVIKLREGVRFHEGEPLTAEDIKFNVERVANQAFGSVAYPRFNKDVIKDVQVLDPLTVRFVINNPPKPKLFNDLTQLNIVSRSWVQATTAEYRATHANGTGPYKLVRFLPEQVAEMERFDQWWGGKVAFKKLTMRFVDEEASRLALMQRGEADIMYGLTPDLVQVAESAGLDVSAVNTRTPGLVSLYNLSANNPLDPSQPNPLRDVRVRLACNYAVNREEILKRVMRGFGWPMKAWIAEPGMRGYVPPEELTPFTYNPDKAKQLLREAGFPQGFKNRIYVPDGVYIKGTEVGLAVAAQLSEVGIKTAAEPIPFSIFLDKIRSNKLEPMHLDLGFPAAFDPWTLPDNMMGALKWFEDAELKQAFQDTFKLTVEEQNAGLRRMNKIMWEKVPNIWLWHPPLIWATSRQIQWPAAGHIYGADFYNAAPR